MQVLINWNGCVPGGNRARTVNGDVQLDPADGLPVISGPLRVALEDGSEVLSVPSGEMSGAALMLRLHFLALLAGVLR